LAVVCFKKETSSSKMTRICPNPPLFDNPVEFVCIV
jgi:hypothetical protein